MDVAGILAKYFQGQALSMVEVHGSAVSGLSVAIGISVGLSEEELFFLKQAAMLHDVGICRVRAPEIGLCGAHPYIMHGILGREILEDEGFPDHALVCERHIGVGLTEADIVNQGLPLPVRDMSPQGLLEEIICFSDLFFSKRLGFLEQIISVEVVRQRLARFGEVKVQIFDSWLHKFGSVFQESAYCPEAGGRPGYSRRP